MIAPFAAGGATDTVTRTYAERLSAALGQTVIVDNRPGASGTIGLDLAAKAVPDGYTLAAADGTMAIAANLNRNLPYDPRTSFAPISLVSLSTHVLVVHASVPAASVREFIALAKQKPGAYAYATSGAGTEQHLSGELIKKMAGIQMTHVPYKGGGQAIVDLVGGQVPVAILGAAPVIPHARAGRLRVLAVTAGQRSSVLPDVPTLAESGFAGFDVSQWLSFVAPAKTPASIVSRLNAEIARIAATPAVREKLATLGIEPATSTPPQLADRIRVGIETAGRRLKELGIEPD
jgi:tripartite-type tricarboxylate transporter receptor subunit TctC